MSNYPPEQLPIDITASGDNLLLAAVPNQRIVVLGYTLMARSTVDARWKSGSNNKSGLLPLIDSTGASPAYNPKGVIICGVGEALTLNLSSAVYVGGHFTYEIHA